MRLGNKILRQRLKGPSIAAYYPPRPVPFGKFRRAYKQMGNTVENEDEDDRLEKVEEYVTSWKVVLVVLIRLQIEGAW